MGCSPTTVTTARDGTIPVLAIVSWVGAVKPEVIYLTAVLGLFGGWLGAFMAEDVRDWRDRRNPR